MTIVVCACVCAAAIREFWLLTPISLSGLIFPFVSLCLFSSAALPFVNRVTGKGKNGLSL